MYMYFSILFIDSSAIKEYYLRPLGDVELFSINDKEYITLWAFRFTSLLSFTVIFVTG